MGIAAEADSSISEYGIVPKRHDLIHTFLKDV